MGRTLAHKQPWVWSDARAGCINACMQGSQQQGRGQSSHMLAAQLHFVFIRRQQPGGVQGARLLLALRRQQWPGEGAAAAGVDAAGRQRRREARTAPHGGGKGGAAIQGGRAGLGRQRPLLLIDCRAGKQQGMRCEQAGKQACIAAGKHRGAGGICVQVGKRAAGRWQTRWQGDGLSDGSAVPDSFK
jgi:hypothetical protein